MSFTRDHLIPLVDEDLGAGIGGLAVLAGGAGDWWAATGKPLEEGP